MTNPAYHVPYGRGQLAFDLPAGLTGRVLESHSVPALADPVAAVTIALKSPVAGPCLAALARPGNRVTIVVTDSTRACPDHLLVPPVVAELLDAGVARADITIVVGIGLHRPSTPAEWIEKLGPEIAGLLRIVNPEPTNPAALVDLGMTAEGVPAIVCRGVVEADLVVATGIVEPHQYAGYSGGRKTVAIGAGGELTIQVSHGMAMLEHPGVRLGRIDGNPFHAAITEIARRAGLRFVVNAVLNDAGQVVAVAAGEPDATLRHLVAFAERLFTIDIAGPADVVVAGVGHPKDANLYQASRGASYLCFAPTPVVRRGGVIVLPARAEEGVGTGLGERRFHELMRSANSPAELIDDARHNGYPAGGQRAVVMAKVLEHCQVIVVGAAEPALVRDLKMLPVATMAEALDLAQSAVGGSPERPASAYVIPHALLTLPIVRAPVAGSGQ